MNIAIFTDAFYPQIGGITTALINHIKSFVDRGHKIIVFAPKYKELNKEIKIKNTKIIRNSSISSLLYKEQKISFPNIIKIINILKEFEIDIIHIQSPGPIGIVGCLSAKIMKKPLIGTYHTLASEFAVYFSFKSNMNIQKLKKKNNKYKIRKNLIWSLTINFYNMCDLVTVPSLSMINELKKHKIKCPVKYISNGLNLVNFKPKKTYETGQVKIAHVGRLGYEKNVDVIIKSLSYVIKKYPYLILTIVGDGPAKKDLEKLVKKLNMEKNIKFTGYKNRINLPEIYSSHDIFVTASTMETQGLVILEAMASGLPIIGVKKYAIPDIVIHNKNGFLAEPGNSKKISEYIIKLIEDKKLQERFGKKSLEISREHDLSKIIIEMEKTYKNLLKSYNINNKIKQFPKFSLYFLILWLSQLFS
jgi:1,2-diacylglycerol 3-alpha-glucosyltransferase